jgi:hypothetical protein
MADEKVANALFDCEKEGLITAQQSDAIILAIGPTINASIALTVLQRKGKAGLIDHCKKKLEQSQGHDGGRMTKKDEAIYSYTNSTAKTLANIDMLSMFLVDGVVGIVDVCVYRSIEKKRKSRTQPD